MVYTILLKNISTVSIGGLTPSTMSSADVWKQIRLKARDQDKVRLQKSEKVADLTLALAGGLRSAERRAAADPGQLAAGRAAVDTLWRGLATEQARSVADLSLQSYRVELHRIVFHAHCLHRVRVLCVSRRRPCPVAAGARSGSASVFSWPLSIGGCSSRGRHSACACRSPRPFPCGSRTRSCSRRGPSSS